MDPLDNVGRVGSVDDSEQSRELVGDRGPQHGSQMRAERSPGQHQCRHSGESQHEVGEGEVDATAADTQDDDE